MPPRSNSLQDDRCQEVPWGRHMCVNAYLGSTLHPLRVCAYVDLFSHFQVFSFGSLNLTPNSGLGSWRCTLTPTSSAVRSNKRKRAYLVDRTFKLESGRRFSCLCSSRLVDGDRPDHGLAVNRRVLSPYLSTQPLRSHDRISSRFREKSNFWARPGPLCVIHSGIEFRAKKKA